MSKEGEEKSDCAEEMANSGERKRYHSYVIDNVMRSSDELYKLCSSDEDATLCEEVISILQKLLFEFKALRKQLESEHSPILSDMKDTEAASGVECSDVSMKQNKSCGDNDAYLSSSSPGINVSAPDFVPSSFSSQLESSCLSDNKPFTNEGKKYKTQSLQNYPFASNNSQHSFFNSRNYDNTLFNNQNYSHSLVSPNMYSFHPYQYSTHYIPPLSPFHVTPFSVYSHEMRNPNLMHIPALSTFQEERPYHVASSQYRNSNSSPKSRTPFNVVHKQHSNNKYKKQYAKKNIEKNNNSMKEVKKKDNVKDNSKLFFSDREKHKNVAEHNNVEKYSTEELREEKIKKADKTTFYFSDVDNSTDMKEHAEAYSIKLSGEVKASKEIKDTKNISENANFYFSDGEETTDVKEHRNTVKILPPEDLDTPVEIKENIKDITKFYFSGAEKITDVKEHTDKYSLKMLTTEKVNATENGEMTLHLTTSQEGIKSQISCNNDTLLHCPDKTKESFINKPITEIKTNERNFKPENIKLPKKNDLKASVEVCNNVPQSVMTDKMDNSQVGKQVVLGLNEDECLLHFPKLSSGQQKKSGRSKVSSLQNSLVSSVKALTNDAPKPKNNKQIFGISFSDVTKVKQDMIGKQSEPCTPPSSVKNKTEITHGCGQTPVRQDYVKKGEEQCNDFILPPDNEETEDSGGWEVVKTRSKWRDSIDLRAPKQTSNKFLKNSTLKDSKSIEMAATSSGSNVSSMNVKVKTDGRFNAENSGDVKNLLDKSTNVKNSSDKSVIMKNATDKPLSMRITFEKVADEKNSIDKQVNMKNISEKTGDMKTIIDKQALGRKSYEKHFVKSSIDKSIHVKNNAEKTVDVKTINIKQTIEKNNSEKSIDLKSNVEKSDSAKCGLVKIDNFIEKPTVTKINFQESSGGKTSFKKSVVCNFRNEIHIAVGPGKPQKSLHTYSTPENQIMKSESFNDSYSNEGRSSSETLDEHLIIQSEETSPELGLYDDNVTIDPNEMYSAYMKYLSNVEAEEDSSEESQLECVLHPEILSGLAKESENGQNPASLEQMTYFVNNDPVRALAFKKKLDSRIRHQEDMKKKNDEKQQLAHEKRLQLLQDKTAKIRGFVQKVEEVKAAQHELALQRKNKLDLKLKKAEEKRNMHLNIIKRKAHDEEEKLKEIAFINELEAQNRRHDSLALRQEQEERLQCLVEERQRRLEEKAAKEAAVEERRKALEAERQEKLELMKEKRRQKEEFIDRKQQEREQERLVIAREKAREREVRLMARHTAHQATLEELQKKIQQKQEESAKRHIESIELIRQKAIEIGIHRYTSDNSVPKYLNLYKPDGKSNKAPDKLCLKKRLKKIKSRMILRGSSYLQITHKTPKEPTTKEAILGKVMHKLQKHSPHRIYLWEPEDCDVVDRALDELLVSLQEEPTLKIAMKDMKAFLFFDNILNTFNYSNHEKCSVPSLRCILKVITICDLSCFESVEVCLYFLLSNILATLLDSLRFSLQALERPCKSWDLIVELLLRFHALVIDGLNELPEELLIKIPDFAQRMKDLISYILCSGLVNKLIDLFRPSIIDEKFIYKSLVVPSILFFKRLLSPWFISDDLVDILKSTDLLCTVPLLYEGLMKQITNGGPLPEYCMPSISLFLKLADLDLKVFQDILGAENIALQWRGIASALMTYCVSQNNVPTLLNSVIRLVGYFAIHNKENQTLLQSGKQPTVLQQLVKLPFQYFCDPEYMQELFPTLISCSYNNSTNRAIVENEIDYSGLEQFMHSEAGQKNVIIQLLLESDGQNDSSTIEESPKCSIHVPD